MADIHPEILERLVANYLRIWKEQGELKARAWADMMFPNPDVKKQFVVAMRRRNNER